MSLFGANRDRDRERGLRSAQERERARLEREARRRGVPVESLAPDPPADEIAPDPPADDHEPPAAEPEPVFVDGADTVGEAPPVDDAGWDEEPFVEEPPAPPVDEAGWDEEPPVEDPVFEDQPPAAAPGRMADAAANEGVRVAACAPVEQSTVEWSALERSLAEDPGPPSGNGTGSHESVTLPEEEIGEPQDRMGDPFEDEAGEPPPPLDAPAGEPAGPLAPRVARLRANRTTPGARFRRRERPAGNAGSGGSGGPPRAPRRPAERGPRPPGGARKWITRAVVPLLIVAVLAIGWFTVSLYQPFTGSGGDAVRVTVPSGLSTRQIGDLLDDKGVVGSGFFFALKARIDGNKGSLKAGTYTFREGMSYEDAQAILLRGPPPIRTVTLRLPEGNTERDFASAVDKSGKVRGGYMRAVRRARFNPARYGAPAGSPLEGFLFPATYELNKKDATARALVAEQLSTFKRNFRRVSMRRARRADLTPYDVLTIASMVEREAQLPRERPVIAGVIYNRLAQGVPLGIDATIRYATNNWTRPIRQSQLDAPGPYNTRLNQGLPPTPIGNPGIASIRAAANPKTTDYLFFVVKPGGDGAHAFSRTDAEFQRDVARYNNARTAAGGQDPK